MCRIHGYLGGSPLPEAALTAVGSAQRHGGPDAQTLHSDHRWALGSNRLAVQGIEHGQQPYRLGPSLMAVFNGEIYNHKWLRRKLSRRGYRFEGTCDGDVLLPLYECYGEQFVQHLEGMYAIAIVDSRAHEPVLKLFADHAAMKTLYYFVHGDQLCFASELRALQQFPGFPDQVDRCAVDRYFGGKAVWGPTTIFPGVRSLPPGGVVEFSSSGGVVQRSIDLAARLSENGVLTLGREPAAPLGELLRDEMARMTAADVPVCAITSGGLDSSLLTALAAELGPVDTFNISYRGDWPGDERHHAATVAAHCGTRHHQVELDPREFPELIVGFVEHLDQPNNAPHSLSTYALFQAVHAAGFKCAITGDGADELFAGYRRFLTAAADTSPAWHRAYQSTLAVAPGAILAHLYSDAYRRELQAAGGFFTDQVGDQLAAGRAASAEGNLEALLRFDQHHRFPDYILRRVDTLSMAWAVEARMPFLQPAIMAFAHQLPASAKIGDGRGKAPVTDLGRGVLPQSIIDRPKQPFTLPITAMMRPGQPLHEMVGDVVLAAHRCKDLFDPLMVKESFARHSDAPNDQDAQLLWSILILETWLSVRGLTL
ncbi:asparagine synthase (glutamine-hydrolyzing) [Nocardia sp. XZ_19_369]|uniref:asparagine synthase (glutamine-hydrolyzing) n=1 Tax=Nocardia sp. XZ_19_369 TaxID=2769487 RepID=UPI00188F158F|nr:asparagine synthase (glutamine-hydrolyzing) [Nocardia sp. XZ_19_369]